MFCFSFKALKENAEHPARWSGLKRRYFMKEKRNAISMSIIVIVIIIIISVLVCYFFNKNNYKTVEFGNNSIKSAENIKEYILNISSYEASISLEKY